MKSDQEINRDMQDDAFMQEHICDGACMCCSDSDGCEYFDSEHCSIINCMQCSHYGVCEYRK